MTRGFIDGEYQDGELRGLNFLVGLRGFGKTTEMDRLLQLCTGGVLFFDTLSKHGDVLHGYVVLSDPDHVTAYLRVNRGRRFRILYQPRGGNLDFHFREICKIVRAFGWMIFGVDELDKLCGNQYSPTNMPPEMYELVNYGRHHRVSMIATARRPKAVPAGYRDEAEFRVFRLKADVAELLAGDLGKETVARIVQLPKFYYLHCVQDGEPVLRGGPRPGLS